MSTQKQTIPLITTSEGLKIRTLRSSKGAPLALGDMVGVFYAGSLTDGTPFDANFNFEGAQPVAGRQLFAFTLGASQVIRGWDLGLHQRRLGEVLELTIPAALGYGSRGTGRIPPNATLVFRVAIVGRIAKGKATPEYFTLADLGINETILNTRQREGNTNTVLGTDLADVLRATPGKNLMAGFGNRDRFSFTTLADAAPGIERDVIIDFKGGRQGDQIDLRLIDADAQKRGNQTFKFIRTKAFSGTAGELRYFQGILQGDVNGDRKADLELDLVGAPPLGITNVLL
jgi:hypothetical protein